MERLELERRVILLQARLRGFQVRKVLSSVRQQYEDIVREIEGDASALVWKGGVIPAPRFTAPLPAWAAGGAQLSQGRLTEEGGRSDGQLHALVAERDCHRGRPPAHQAAAAARGTSSAPAGGDGELSLSSESCAAAEAVADGMWSGATQTTSVWGSMAVDAPCSLLREKGPHHRTRVQDLPKTPEDLRLHRNSLAMELLWLQQAIGSRKKYLVLKQRLATPGR